MNEPLKEHFYLTLEMLRKECCRCPGELWSKETGHLPFWRHLFHALESLDWWFCLKKEDYIASRKYSFIPEDMKKTPGSILSRKQMLNYFQLMEKKCKTFFKTPERAFILLEDHPKLTPEDLVLTQIRHLQYHQAYCSAILSQQGIEKQEWLEARGRTS